MRKRSSLHLRGRRPTRDCWLHSHKRGRGDGGHVLPRG
ncbi:unnamed protein product [Spirodela intermedia]|uniref:Uncharacterized protein n=2 Tax=Spirodela intermedia TaxID=51605 RepID=A0A7I8IZ56_SPIIN|nr:unnamed protein product [Spirodela intermedia]CAA6663158.1 unnamed protein product [Spirodela intermedia]CAA7399603.1 unnamed protein product [Spirodela intermedia]